MVPVTRWQKLVLLLACGVCGLHAQTRPPAPDPASVVVVANRQVPGSERVARAYLQRRSIPEQNLILLETSADERISRSTYLDSIHNPLIEKLRERRLVESLEGSPDSFGRKAPVVIRNNVRYLVLCFGMPLLVNAEPEGPPDDLAQRRRHLGSEQAGLIGAFSEGPLAKDEATVDGELALLLKREIPINGFLPNPHYRNQQLEAAPDVLRVTRLDGPNPEAVIRMIDSALDGERRGLRGRAYIDQDARTGDYQLGNDWLQAVADMLKLTGMDASMDAARPTLAADSRFDAPVIYAGWYAENINGPFRLPGFRFPEGAVAVHLHSFSARTLRDPNRGWVGPFVERGVAATVGNVTEPYLTLTHNFDLLFAALLSGWTFGDAAAFALPGLSWQAIAVGDPLYRPFARTLEEQVAAVGNPTQILADQYVVLRQVNLLTADGKAEEAIQAAARGMLSSPGPALGLRRAQLLMEAGRRDQALSALAFMSRMRPGDSADWGLFASIADTLRELGDPGSALEIYQKLERQTMPQPVLLAFLRRGIQAAQDAGRADIAIEWQARVTPAPAPATPSPQTSPNNRTNP